MNTRVRHAPTRLKLRGRPLSLREKAANYVMRIPALDLIGGVHDRVQVAGVQLKELWEVAEDISVCVCVCVCVRPHET